ncbi:transforming growth factor-beta-induced protein ig-h3 [Halyomorpha halys]|uniref:transforming growth factor-beta-induced protein ig-h3 n=1 Tax=Halyomorpha halys TaxID=286706 RepID=UPI0006D523CB|nr:transforming growth factor-beta-induced protein ig-h3 [Halyomorpha halys]
MVKLSFLLLLVGLVCLASSRKIYDDPNGLRLTGLAKRDVSREELEDDKGLTDQSASQENTKEETTKKPEEIDDDEDSDEDPFDLIPVRSIFDNLPNIFGISQPKSWWSGPNVCVDREEKEEKSDDFGSDFIAFGSAQFSTCQNTPSKYTCKTITKKNGNTKTVIVSYQCCHGFRRTSGNPGCSKVETKPIADIAEELGASKFADLVKTTGLEKELEGNVTIFLPSDQAVSEHHDDLDSMNQILTNEVQVSNSPIHDEKALVRAHVVDGVYEVSDMYDEMILPTRDNSTLRINFLPNRPITVNCIRMNTTDRLTEKGVVHIVDSLIQPVKGTIADRLSESKFSKFKDLLEQSDLWNIMSGDKALTVFAVENEAVEKIGDKYKMCMKNILAHHILPHSLCSIAADSSNLATLDITKSWLPFTKKDDFIIIGNKTKLIETDFVTTNGIVHTADSFVVPSSARSISELLEQSNHKEWLSVVQKSGLLDRLETTENVTMFVPTNEAVKEAIDSDMSPDELEKLVRFHIAKDQEGHSISTWLDGQNLTVSAEKNLFPSLLGMGRVMSVQCTPLTKIGGRVCNGVLHEIESVMKPATETVDEYIESNPELTTFHKMMEGTKIESEIKEGHLGSDITLLAIINKAFDDLDPETLDLLLKDKTLADEVIRSHILKEPICCKNIAASSWPFLPVSQSLSGRVTEVYRKGSVAVFGQVPTVSCDHVVKGAVVHLVDGIKFTHQRPRDRELILRKPNSEIILAGI